MKVFVTIDTTDLSNFNQMLEWKDQDGNNLQLVNGLSVLKRLDKEDDEVLKEELHKLMDDCDVVAVVIDKATKSFKKFTRWQMEYAAASHIPTIALNVNGIRSVDYDRCTAFMKKTLSLHLAFQEKIFAYALANWPEEYSKKALAEEKKTYRYSNDLYASLGLQTADFA